MEEKEKKTLQFNKKVSEKGAMSFYGIGRFPVTLYENQWRMLLGDAPNILKFLDDNRELLKKKEVKESE